MNFQRNDVKVYISFRTIFKIFFAFYNRQQGIGKGLFYQLADC